MVKFLYIVCIAKHKKTLLDSMSGLFLLFVNISVVHLKYMQIQSTLAISKVDDH